MTEERPEILKVCPTCKAKLDGVARQRGVCRVCGTGLPRVEAKPAVRDRRIRHTEDERGRHGEEKQ